MFRCTITRLYRLSVLIVFLALLPGYFLSIFYRSFLSVVAGPVMTDLGIGPRELGFLGATWFIVFSLAQFPVGWALDRLGPRRTVSGAMALGSAGALLFAFAPNIAVAFAGMALIGFGCSPIFMGALFLFARTAEPARFASLTSNFLALGSFGNVAGAAPLAMAAQALGWRSAMLGMAVLFMGATLLAFALIRDPKTVDDGGGGSEGLLEGLRSIVRIRALWLIVPMALLSYGIVATARGLWVAPFLEQVHGLPPVSAGHAATAMAVAMILGAYGYGVFERRLGRAKPLVFWGTLVTAACFGMLALAGSVELWLAIVLFALIGGVGFTYAILMTHMRVFFPPHLMGRGMTFANFLFIAGAALMQSASGWLIADLREAGGGPVESFAALHWLFAVVLLVIAAIYWFSRERPELDPQQIRH